MKLVFASHNLHKVEEVRLLLPDHIELLSLKDIGCTEDIPETSDTIQGNALLKVQHVRKYYNLNSFADDTGLEVDVLNGAPGVYSARYAGPAKKDSDNVKKLLQNMAGTVNRKARFKTVIALDIHQEIATFTGICEGEILSAPRGKKGFGYDPVFSPHGYIESFAEMPQEEKNRISHRGRALEKLIVYLQAQKKH